MRIERIALENHRDAALTWGQMVHDCAADQDLTRGRLLKPGDHAQQRGLAGTGGAEEHEELALASLQIHIVDSRGLALLEDLREISGFDDCHSRPG